MRHATGQAIAAYNPSTATVHRFGPCNQALIGLTGLLHHVVAHGLLLKIAFHSSQKLLNVP